MLRPRPHSQTLESSCTPAWRTGFWLPHGFTITAGEEYYYEYGFASGAPSIPNYFNGTGNGAYNGTLQTGGIRVLHRRIRWALTVPTATTCTYYYAIYDPYECQYILNYCEGSGPITVNNPINETEWNLPGVTTAGGRVSHRGGTAGIADGNPYKFEFGTTAYSAVSPNAVLVSSVPPVSIN